MLFEVKFHLTKSRKFLWGIFFLIYRMSKKTTIITTINGIYRASLLLYEPFRKMLQTVTTLQFDLAANHKKAFTRKPASEYKLFCLTGSHFFTASSSVVWALKFKISLCLEKLRSSIGSLVLDFHFSIKWSAR